MENIDDETMSVGSEEGEKQQSPPSPPVLARFEVANTIFEIPERYKLMYAVGQGAFGIVCSGIDETVNQKVAVKKIWSVFTHEKDFQRRILREIKILKHFDHDNIISLYDLAPPRNKKEFQDVYIVTDLMETDLRQIIKSEQVLTDSHVQYFMYQLLRALKYVHSANVLHRDLKPGNILLNSDCELKICDFGLAKGIDFTSDNPIMSTPYVATRWYRSPELLLMSDKASKAIDIWSVGCIFAELLGRKVLFPGNNYMHQLELIVDILGTPKESEIEGCDKGKQFIKSLPFKKKRPFKTLFPNSNQVALDLLDRMLTFDPKIRINVEDALSHPYLKSLHAESDEPVCAPFDFSFEDQAKTGDLKEMIYQEIMEWNFHRNNVAGDATFAQPKKMNN